MSVQSDLHGVQPYAAGKPGTGVPGGQGGSGIGGPQATQGRRRTVDRQVEQGVGGGARGMFTRWSRLSQEGAV